jgi:hypothetical protein
MSSAEPVKKQSPGLFPVHLKWQPVAAGLAAVAVVAVLAISLPLLGGHPKQVSAEEIALSSPEVQAILSGATSGPTNVTANINLAGYSRVVTMGPWDKVVVSYVDVLNKQLVCVLVGNIVNQSAGDAADQQALGIVNADIHTGPELQAFLDQGLSLYFMKFTVAYPVAVSDPQSITGLPEVIFLKDQAWAKYYFIVNPSGTVSGGGSADIAPIPGGGHFEVFVMEGLGPPNQDDFYSMFEQIHQLMSQ